MRQMIGLITIEMASTLEIAAEWIGWKLCPAHLKEYGARRKKLENEAKRKEKVGEGGESLTTHNKKQKRPLKDDARNKASSNKKARTTNPAEEKQSPSEDNSNRKDENEAEKFNPRPQAIDSVTLQPIGLFESCFVERNGTPRQGMLVPSSRGKLKLRRCLESFHFC